MNKKIYDIRIKEITNLLPPVALSEKYPVTEKAAATVISAREKIHNIMKGNDDRPLRLFRKSPVPDPLSFRAEGLPVQQGKRFFGKQ